MSGTVPPERGEGTRTDDLGVVALVAYGAVLWGWARLIDLFTPAGGPVVVALFVVPVVWGLATIGLVRQRRWGWTGTLVLGGLTTIAFALGDALVPTAVLGGAVLYVLNEGGRFRSGSTSAE